MGKVGRNLPTFLFLKKNYAEEVTAFSNDDNVVEPCSVCMHNMQ
jgi:hypothetical protein